MSAVQVVYGAACVALAVPLIVQFGPAANVSNATSVRILGGALLALAVGAFTAALEPSQHRSMLRVEIVFTGLTALFLTYRLLSHRIAGDRACYLLPLVTVGLALLLVLYPSSTTKPSSDNDGSAT